MAETDPKQAVTDESARLKNLSDKLADIPDALKSQAFTRLLAVDDATRPKPETYWKELGATVALAAAAAVALVLGWHYAHSIWTWLNQHWILFALIAAVVAAAAAWAAYSGNSPLGWVSGKAVAGIALVTAAITLLFTLYPNLKPTTEESLTIDQLSLERHVTLKQYANQPEVTAAIKATKVRSEDASIKQFLGANKPYHQYRYGTVVNFHVAEKGLSKKAISFRWSLFAAPLREPVANAEQRDPWCLFKRWVDQKNEGATVPRSPASAGARSTRPKSGPSCATFKGALAADEGSFAVWVNARGVKDGYKRGVSCFFIRIDGYERGNRLAYADSGEFPTMSKKSTKKCVPPKANESKRAATMASHR